MSDTNTGGLPVLTLPALAGLPGQSQGLLLMSDLHIGSSQTDYERIKEDLKVALDRGDRVLLGGDVFDLLLPSDRKRYQPARLHGRLRGRNDIVNASVDWAEEILSPYAGIIDAVGHGNHESAALAHHSIDAVGQLCQRLGVAAAAPQQAGYTAYLRYPVKGPKRKVADAYTIWYTHGAGRAKTAAEALKFLLGRTSCFQADAYWCGHFHARATCCEVGVRLDADGNLRRRDVRCVVSGGYVSPYGPQDQESVRKSGLRGNYASDGALLPHGLGSARIVLHFGPHGAIRKVEVSQ